MFRAPIPAAKIKLRGTKKPESIPKEVKELTKQPPKPIVKIVKAARKPRNLTPKKPEVIKPATAPKRVRIKKEVIETKDNVATDVAAVQQSKRVKRKAERKPRQIKNIQNKDNEQQTTNIQEIVRQKSKKKWWWYLLH